MVFNDSTNLTGIVNEIDFNLGTDATSYPLKEKTRNVNNWYNRVASLIIRADSRWEWDDNNRTDLPIATTALVANQQDYTISGESFLDVIKVEIKDQNGNWQALNPISLADKRNESMTDYRKDAGTPVEYDKFGNSIFLYPKPNYSSSASLKVFYQRNVSLFVSTDTTKIPGFAENFHRILSYGACYDYCLAYGLNTRIPLLRDEIAKLESAIIDYYSSRFEDEKNRLSLYHEDYNVE